MGEGTEQPTQSTFCWRHSPSRLRTTLTHVIRVNSGRVEAELDEDGKQESKAQPLDDMQRGAARWRQQVTAQHCTLPSPAHHRDHLRLPPTYEVGSTREQQGIKMRCGKGRLHHQLSSFLETLHEWGKLQPLRASPSPLLLLNSHK